MRFRASLLAHAKPREVWDALHRYKIARDPTRFFPSRFVRWRFRVLSQQAVGVGALYDWEIRVLGVRVLSFRERVVEWSEGRCAAYEAVSGWNMRFRVELHPASNLTRVDSYIDFSFGHPRLDRLLAPFVEWGLGRVSREGLRKEGIRVGAPSPPTEGKPGS